MKIGDAVTKPLDWLDEAEVSGGRRLMKKTSLTGTVVYIHPRLRFYTLEFRLPHGSFRECFFFEVNG